jgi:hypothetical protein
MNTAEIADEVVVVGSWFTMPSAPYRSRVFVSATAMTELADEAESRK